MIERQEVRSGLLGLGCALALGAVSFPACAQHYTVSMNPNFNGLDIQLVPQENPRMLLVDAVNKTNTKVRCDFSYEVPAQFPYRTTVWIKPNGHSPSTFPADENVFSIQVNVTCNAATD